jgi:hypothetical protein
MSTRQGFGKCPGDIYAVNFEAAMPDKPEDPWEGQYSEGAGAFVCLATPRDRKGAARIRAS